VALIKKVLDKLKSSVLILQQVIRFLKVPRGTTLDMMFNEKQLRTSQGKLRTKSLFWELSYFEPEHVIFTLREEDLVKGDKTYVSLRKLYLSYCCTDPTEYTFAWAVFGSWETWQQLCRSNYIKKDIDTWRREVEIKIKSEAIRSIADEMRTGGRSSFGAAKLLLERGWLDDKNASKAKEKLKAKEEEELNQQALSLLSEDAERLGIKVQ
jgi:hypothetical protein